MRSTRDQTNLARMHNHTEAAVAILADIRINGTVDIGACLRDRVKLGALATLEHDGDIERNGPVDARQMQPYRVAANDDERAAFKARRIAADRASWDRMPPAARLEGP